MLHKFPRHDPLTSPPSFLFPSFLFPRLLLAHDTINKVRNKRRQCEAVVDEEKQGSRAAAANEKTAVNPAAGAISCSFCCCCIERINRRTETTSWPPSGEGEMLFSPLVLSIDVYGTVQSDVRTHSTYSVTCCCWPPLSQLLAGSATRPRSSCIDFDWLV